MLSFGLTNPDNNDQVSQPKGPKTLPKGNMPKGPITLPKGTKRTLSNLSNESLNTTKKSKTNAEAASVSNNKSAGKQKGKQT